jgi:hypothetical protein
METINFIGSICSILAFLIAIFLITQIIKIKTIIKDKSSNVTHQSENKVKYGDMAGRDINK